MTDGNAPVAHCYPEAAALRHEALLERLDAGGNFRGYSEGFGDSWTELCSKAAQTIRSSSHEIDRLRTALAKSCDEGRFEDVDAGCMRAVVAEAEVKRLLGVAQSAGMTLEKPDGWIVKNGHGGIELFLDHDRAIAALSAWGSWISPIYAGTIDWKMESERANGLLADAQRIIAEYQAGTIAGAKADVAAHGLPGARGRATPYLTSQVVRLRYATIGYLEVFDRCGGSESVSPETFAAARQDLRDAVAFSSTHQSAPPFTASQNIAEREPSSDAALGGADTRLAERLLDVVFMLDAPDVYNREYITAVCRSILSSVTFTPRGGAI